MTELQRKGGEVMNRIRRGESVLLTERGRLVARIVPEVETRVVSLAEFCAAEMSDEAILRAIEEARE